MDGFVQTRTSGVCTAMCREAKNDFMTPEMQAEYYAGIVYTEDNGKGELWEIACGIKNLTVIDSFLAEHYFRD